MESFGVSEDIAANVGAIIYCSPRLDVPEMKNLTKIFKGQMSKVQYKDAKNGVGLNPVVKANVDYR
jgi:hypothetical protein